MLDDWGLIEDGVVFSDVAGLAVEDTGPDVVLPEGARDALVVCDELLVPGGILRESETDEELEKNTKLGEVVKTTMGDVPDVDVTTALAVPLVAEGPAVLVAVEEEDPTEIWLVLCPVVIETVVAIEVTALELAPAELVITPTVLAV